MHGIARGVPLHRVCAAAHSGTAPTLSHLKQSFSSASSTPASPVDYYKVLGLTPSASLDDIKRTFREQAKKHHPDLAKGPSEADSLAAFKLVNEAYSVLSDASEWCLATPYALLLHTDTDDESLDSFGCTQLKSL